MYHIQVLCSKNGVVMSWNISENSIEDRASLEKVLHFTDWADGDHFRIAQLDEIDSSYLPNLLALNQLRSHDSGLGEGIKHAVCDLLTAGMALNNVQPIIREDC